MLKSRILFFTKCLKEDKLELLFSTLVKNWFHIFGPREIIENLDNMTDLGS